MYPNESVASAVRVHRYQIPGVHHVDLQIVVFKFRLHAQHPELRLLRALELVVQVEVHQVDQVVGFQSVDLQLVFGTFQFVATRVFVGDFERAQHEVQGFVQVGEE
jgi:hypothetical protein